MSTTSNTFVPRIEYILLEEDGHTVKIWAIDIPRNIVQTTWNPDDSIYVKACVYGDSRRPPVMSLSSRNTGGWLYTEKLSRELLAQCIEQVVWELPREGVLGVLLGQHKPSETCDDYLGIPTNDPMYYTQEALDSYKRQLIAICDNYTE